jgi:hypothetical protein
MIGTPEWLEMVRTTGRWDRPRFWRHPGYRELSPWTPEELTAAFDALRSVYPPGEVRRIFSESEDLPWLATILIDPWRPDLSGLLALGFDALHAGIKHYPDLRAQLRNKRTYPGARLEVAVLASLERTGVRFEYEPFARESKLRAKRGESFPNPDLRLRLGISVIVDIKRMISSARADRRLKRLMLLLHGPSENWQPLLAACEVTERYIRIEHANYSEDRLDQLARSLHELARQTIENMRNRGITTQTIGGGLLKLDLSHQQSRGLPLSHPGDADRVNSKLNEGATQIPAGERGVIIVQPSGSDDLRVVAATARAWLELAKPEVLGVVLLGEQWLPDRPGTICVPYPLWRSTAPAKLRKPAHWRRLAAGLSWHSLYVKPKR